MAEEHGHNHDHDHGHHHGHHHHAIEPGQLNRAFMAGIILNSAFVFIEVVAGFWTNSLALLTDAGHNLGDVAGLALSLVAFRLTRVKADKNFTYGYNKTTVLAALVNAVVLLVAIGGIGYEAVQRLFHPEPAQGGIMALVALIGILINTASAMLFMRDKDKDLNVKGAYLHLASDAVVSLGVVIGGVIIYFTHWYLVDSIISLAIMVVILYGTWGLLTDSLRLSLDAVPRNIQMQKVMDAIAKIPGITNVHHVHIWALSTQVNALTAHIVVDDKVDAAGEQKLKENIKHKLLHLNIQHATLETERSNAPCKDGDCE